MVGTDLAHLSEKFWGKAALMNLCSINDKVNLPDYKRHHPTQSEKTT